MAAVISRSGRHAMKSISGGLVQVVRHGWRTPLFAPSMGRDSSNSLEGFQCGLIVGQTRLAHTPQATASATTAGSQEEQKTVTLSVDGRQIRAQEGQTVLQACREAGIFIPAICYHPALQPVGTCRLCLVDCGGWRLEPACVKPVSEGMKVFTHTAEIVDTVKGNLSLMRLKHPDVCSTCSACNNCEFQDLLQRYQVPVPPLLEKLPRVKDTIEEGGTAHAHDKSSNALEFNFDKCILCLRCVRACHELQGMDVLGVVARGDSEAVAPSFSLPLADTSCISCGACVSVCPVAAITEKSHVQQVRELLEASRELQPHESKARSNELIPLDSADKRILWGPPPSEADIAPSGKPPVVIVQTAPAVRITIGEAFGLDPGAISTGQMVAALRMLGFHYVFDTNFSADLTIMEEATELLERLKVGGPFPMFTSCCPGWMNMVHKKYPHLLPHISTCKSPQQMMGAVMKTFFASTIGRHPSEVKVVSVMPCVAKKDEAAWEESQSKSTGAPDVDFVLTTRELASLIAAHRPRIHFPNLKPELFDSPLGSSSGAALIFGVTGGVMEAALRTAVAVTAPLHSTAMPRLKFQEVRGLQGVKEAAVDVNGTELRIAIANGGQNLQKLLTAIESGTAPPYHFVEMMACRGGCIGGAGNPKDSSNEHLLQRRSAAIYAGDEQAGVRKSHENVDITALYEKFLGNPNSHLSHELLHVHHRPRPPPKGTGIFFPDIHGLTGAEGEAPGQQ